MKKLWSDPVALMTFALAGVVVFGIAHLIADVVAWDGDALAQFGGIATDSQTILTGVALLSAFLMVVDRQLPAPMSSWPGASVVDGWRANPRAQMQPIITGFIAVAVLQAVVAFINEVGDDAEQAVRILLHDTLFLLVIAAFVVTLTAVAASRHAGAWAFAPTARTIVSAGLLLTPILGLILALMRFLDTQGDAMDFALNDTAFVLMEVVVAFGLLIVADIIINSLFPPTDGEGTALPDAYAGVVKDPAALLDKSVPAVALLGGIHVLFGMIFYSDFSGGDALWHLLEASMHTAAAVALIMLARAAAKTDPKSLVEPSGAGNPYAEPLRIATAVVAVAGVLGAAVAWSTWQGDDAWIALYWFFNLLVRTFIIVGVLAGLSALHRSDGTSTF